jgi:hypothetical protein
VYAVLTASFVLLFAQKIMISCLICGNDSLFLVAIYYVKFKKQFLFDSKLILKKQDGRM